MRKHGKVVLLGSTTVGKTSIMNAEMKKQFNDEESATIGGSFQAIRVDLDNGEPIFLDIWDTAGQERYKSLTAMYYRNCTVAVLVYAINDTATFEALAMWLKELAEKVKPMPIVYVVGNKCDLEDERVVDTEQAAAFASARNAEFVETSAKTGQGVAELFASIAMKVGQIEEPDEEPVRVLEPSPTDDEEKKGCC